MPYSSGVPKADGDLRVIAHYRATAGKGDEVAALLTRHAATARNEPGCLQFDALRSDDDDNLFALVERYVSEEAFAHHRTTPHFKTLIEEGVVPLLEERRWSRYSILSGD